MQERSPSPRPQRPPPLHHTPPCSRASAPPHRYRAKKSSHLFINRGAEQLAPDCRFLHRSVHLHPLHRLHDQPDPTLAAEDAFVLDLPVGVILRTEPGEDRAPTEGADEDVQSLLADSFESRE